MNAQRTAIERAPDERVNWVASIPFFAVHLLCLAAIFTGVTAEALVLCVVLYVTRMFFVTAGYHRYFAHRSYRLGRVMQFVMALGGTTAAQKSALWWAGHHRKHHRYSDTEQDLHSPLKGFWWSHLGWILSNKNKGYDPDDIRDFDKFPELRLLHRYDWVPPWLVAIACTLIAGWPGLVVGFFWSTVLLWHGTFTVNSLAHVMGRRRYATTDTSRNSALIALWTGGEGWHNNHHYFQSSARQGFFWWEYDPTYYALKVLSWVGLVRDLKTPPRPVLAAARVRDGSFDMGMFKAHWAKATAALAAARPWDRGGDEPVAVPVAVPLAVPQAVPLAEDELEAEGRTRREQLEARLRDSRAALEDYVHSSMRSAEELAKLSRRHQRAALAD